MMKIFEAANQYVKESDWKTIAALKICVASLGILIGMQVPKKKVHPVACLCAGLYGFTLVPLLWRFVEILLRGEEA